MSYKDVLLLLQGVICMNSYTVKQIAELLKTNEETVRRWIRSGKLKATQDSKKSGNVITSIALNQFIKETPKYATYITSSVANSSLALSVVVGGMLGGLLAFMDEKKKSNLSATDVEKFLNKKIQDYEQSLNIKKNELKTIQLEIAEEEKNIEKYKYALQNLDLQLIAEEINKEKSKGE